ncbi:Jmjc domain-containing protein 7 [Plakobranchus ocellatus]|uniref:Bifunctional peptidase and (3S)-lysyl hydroxylase JMJD7 n=1 Tax=Plakobranchus ocellatus TaxID=259542 RepID=A0AAV4C2X8_9GAST|nr:Jmjc domain-containing protein 7 [Plakobranchus ocellatus]
METEMDKAVHVLSAEMKELYPNSECQETSGAPDPLDFHRNFVSQNRPLLINHAFDHWPALEKWNENYLRSKLGEMPVTVAVTPNGYADAVYDGKFVMPEERVMPMSKFLDIVFTREEDRKDCGVFYIQKQNSNLTDEFSTLMVDVEPHIPWGTTAFGVKPEAVNFWMGDEKAVTSMHRDHYENLYCVVSGEKTFILHPPTDLPYIPYETYRSAVYKEGPIGSFAVISDEKDSEVPWVAIDPLKPDLKRYPQYAQAQPPLIVTVHAGQMLYLPSLWFHHVRQSQACIAVNYWYDMEFDIKWAYYKFLEKLFPPRPL